MRHLSGVPGTGLPVRADCVIIRLSTMQQMQKRKLFVILGVILLAIVGSAVTQKFLLEHQITSVNPNALRTGTSLLAQGLDSNRMQYASLATDPGDSRQ